MTHRLSFFDRRSLGLVAGLGLLALTACQGGNTAHVGDSSGGTSGSSSTGAGSSQGGTSGNAAPGGGSQAPGGASSAESFEGTVANTEQKRPGMKPAVQASVRAATHPGYDRVVFEFQGNAIPGYHIEYIDKPVRHCASGDTIPLAGDGWLRIRLEPAQAHTDEGKSTLPEREIKTNLPNLRELKLTCDFEAQVEWVLGVGSPNKYRVLELQGPPRLVVDVKN